MVGHECHNIKHSVIDLKVSLGSMYDSPYSMTCFALITRSWPPDRRYLRVSADDKKQRRTAKTHEIEWANLKIVRSVSRLYMPAAVKSPHPARWIEGFDMSHFELLPRIQSSVRLRGGPASCRLKNPFLALFVTWSDAAMCFCNGHDMVICGMQSCCLRVVERVEAWKRTGGG